MKLFTFFWLRVTQQAKLIQIAPLRKKTGNVRRLEAVAFESVRPTLYRTEVSLVTY